MSVGMYMPAEYPCQPTPDDALPSTGVTGGFESPDVGVGN